MTLLALFEAVCSFVLAHSPELSLGPLRLKLFAHTDGELEGHEGSGGGHHKCVRTTNAHRRVSYDADAPAVAHVTRPLPNARW